MPAKLPLARGDRFGCLTVVEEKGKQYGKPNYSVVCDCGNTTQALRTFLRADRVACGASCPLRPRRSGADGHAKYPGHFSGTYRTWLAMRQRCYDPDHKSYQYYGAMGVIICERWQYFPNFLADMGERPQGLSIDRFPDTFGNYEPGNCRWANAHEQRQNQRPRR